MTETEFASQQWTKALRCGSVFSDSRLKALYAEGLLPNTRGQVPNYLSNDAHKDFHSVARYAKVIGETCRASRKTSATVDFTRMKTTKPSRPDMNVNVLATESAFTIEEVLTTTRKTDEEEYQAKLLALDSNASAETNTQDYRTLNTPMSRISTQGASSRKPYDGRTLAAAGKGYTNQYGRSAPEPHCRLYFSEDHLTDKCHLIPPNITGILLSV